MNQRVPLLMFIFAGAAAIAWLASVQSTANRLSAPATGAAPAGVTATVDASSSYDGLRRKLSLPDPKSVGPRIPNAAQARDEAPSLRIDLPKFKKLPTDETDLAAWEVVPRCKIDQSDAPIPTTLCACNKCGTTSFYAALYEMTHGKSWEYDGPPWIQTLDNAEWWTDVHATRKVDWDEFADDNAPKGGTNSFALIRDPKERLLSAWKSKVQCSSEGRDEAEWWKFIYPLMQLAGMNKMIIEGRYFKGSWEPCLDLSAFLHVMFTIHSQGKQGLLNGHFRPQHLWCFLHAPPERWTHVVTAKSPDTACRLESVVMGEDSQKRRENCALGKVHATKDISAYANFTEVDRMLLDAITREEYEVLGPYL